VEIKIQSKDALKKRVDKILPFADDINSANASLYLNELKNSCFEQMNKEKLNTSTIHKLRMILKEYLYNFEVIDSNSKLNFKPLYQLQDLIGKWHDLNVIQHHLNNYKRRAGLSIRNAAHLQKVKSGFSERASLLINRINKLKNEALVILHVAGTSANDRRQGLDKKDFSAGRKRLRKRLPTIIQLRKNTEI
jgi:CHAD domain-containing protein